MINEIDADHNGSLDFNEFLKMMGPLSKPPATDDAEYRETVRAGKAI